MSSTVIPHCFKKFTPVRFAEGQNNIFQNELLSGIGAKYGKTVAQVILRWHIQRGVVTIPKSVRKERIAENFDVWDFTLSEEDIAAITAMDSGKSEIIDHFTAGTAKALNGWKIHR
jgi:2,5-diketo-D-gluconate reductase A